MNDSNIILYQANPDLNDEAFQDDVNFENYLKE